MAAVTLSGSAENQLSSVILLNDHGCINGGQAKVAIDTALQLRSRGFDVCFIAGAGPIDPRLIKAGVECHLVGTADILADSSRFRAAARGIWNVAAARALAACIAARDPLKTVVHIHGWAKALSPSIGPVVTRSEAGHVYTLHEYFLACPNGGFYDYRAEKICRRRPLGVGCLTTRCDSRADHHKLWRVARQAVLRSAGNMPRGLREIIYLAPEQRAIMAPHMPAQARWHYLPNPAPPEPKQRVRAEENDLFLFVGRLTAEKGPAVAALAAREADVPIAFCGDGEQRDAVLQVNPDAQMLGWLTEHEIKEWMSRARCVVFPSLWYECHPLVVVDALRAGVPILVSDTCVAASSIEHGVTGRHVVSGSAEAWASAMRMLSSNELVRKYSKGAFRAGQRLLDRDEYISRLIEIYTDALSRKHERVPPTSETAA